MFEIEKIWEMIIALIFACAGGLARLLNVKDTTRLQWSRIFSELFVAGFAGIMVLLLARTFGLAGDWIGLVCGMSGWVGPRILDFVSKPVGKAIGIDINEEKNEEKNEDNK